MKIPDYISHIRKDADGRIVAFQSNEEHSHGVAELARQFANEFGMGDFGYIMGMLHDKGKEKKEFRLSLMKRLSQYSVNLRQHDIEQMIKDDIINDKFMWNQGIVNIIRM